MPYTMLPDLQTIFSVRKNKIPLYLFFNSSKNSGHVHVLRKISFYLQNKHINALTSNEMKKNNAVGLHLDETNMQSGVSFSDKMHLVRNAQNDAEKLANSM